MNSPMLDWWQSLSTEEKIELMAFYYPDRKFEKIKDSIKCIEHVYLHEKPK